MSKWIDADALEEKAKQYSLGYYEADEWAVPLCEISEAPSIDIVFCKECKYEKRCTTNVHFLADNGLDVIPVHFCSYGQKGDENVETD